jgi:Gly-Xaa carboxypeptidase
VIRPVARKLDLALTAYGRAILNGTRGSVALSVRDSSDPSPITIASGTAWRALSSAVRTTFGPHTIISPSLATSNTDTRHYWDLTHSIFRWTPARIGTRLNAHTVNERIKIDTHVEAVQLYHGA